jgi:hypothetical protein
MRDMYETGARFLFFQRLPLPATRVVLLGGLYTAAVTGTQLRIQKRVLFPRRERLAGAGPIAGKYSAGTCKLPPEMCFALFYDTRNIYICLSGRNLPPLYL